MSKQLTKEMSIMNFKINSMTSLEIAELTGKMHKHVLRDIENAIAEMGDECKSLINIDCPNLGSQIESMTYKDLSGIERKCFKLNKLAAINVVAGYSFKLRNAIIKRWLYLEDQLAILKDKSASRKQQLEAMEALHGMLPEIEQGVALNYIKANTVVNKVTSNYFGFPKMLKKDEMNSDLLRIREKVLNDYINLFKVYEDNGIVNNHLNIKWAQPLIENKPE